MLNNIYLILKFIFVVYLNFNYIMSGILWIGIVWFFGNGRNGK